MREQGKAATLTDVLVYRNGYKMGKWERLFLEELEQVKAELVKDDCGRQ